LPLDSPEPDLIRRRTRGLGPGVVWLVYCASAISYAAVLVFAPAGLLRLSPWGPACAAGLKLTTAPAQPAGWSPTATTPGRCGWSRRRRRLSEPSRWTPTAARYATRPTTPTPVSPASWADACATAARRRSCRRRRGRRCAGRAGSNSTPAPPSERTPPLPQRRLPPTLPGPGTPPCSR